MASRVSCGTRPPEMAGTAAVSPVALSGRASGFVTAALAAHPGPVTVLGCFPTACYLELATGEVVAVLTSDAVALPIGIILDTPSWHFSLADWTGPARISADSAVWIGEHVVHLAAVRDVELAFIGTPQPAALTWLDRWLAPVLPVLELPAAAGPGSGAAACEPAELVRDLLGRGPGLTPSGDDLLCGLIAGGRLFGRHTDAHRNEIGRILRNRPRATTSLSRQLLLRACAGEGIRELVELGRALCMPAAPADSVDPHSVDLHRAAAALTAIGHTSGVALTTGMLAAATLTAEPVGPVVSHHQRGSGTGGCG
ncbi:MAG: hypothetical protein QOH56_4476 [Pseudonocardiales bacterium]|nr:hypothetical protein [Pseudonocardiales bacterium]